MKPYHPANLYHQPYGHRRVIVLAWVAKLLGVQFQIGGAPFGGKHKPMPWERQMHAEQSIASMTNPMSQGSMEQRPW